MLDGGRLQIIRHLYCLQHIVMLAILTAIATQVSFVLATLRHTTVLATRMMTALGDAPIELVQQIDLNSVMETGAHSLRVISFNKKTVFS